MSHSREPFNRLMLILSLLALMVMIAILVDVERSYRKEMNETVQATVAAVSKSGLIKTPTDVQVNFSQLESLAESFQASGKIERIFVTKRVLTDEGTEKIVLLHPFYYSTAHPNWTSEMKDMHYAPITQDSKPVGALYLQMDTSALQRVRISICIAILPIAFALLALMARVFRQERVLTATTEILRQNQRELIRMERLSLAGLLTANIFHDIRKPITNIKHELADLGEALDGVADATAALGNMHDQVTLFFDILRDLNLERFVRSDEAGEEYVDSNHMVEQALRLVQYERGSIHLSITLASDLPLVLAHPYRLVQVLSNIILNAYQALEGRGELHIATATDTGQNFLAQMDQKTAKDEKQENTDTKCPLDLHSDTKSIQVGSVQQDANVIIIHIFDNGPGIADKDLRDIFAPFHSSKPSDKGTGLGLYISRLITEELGGAIRVETCAGIGTRFTVVLPATD